MKKKKIPKIRNRIAISAWNRPGAGKHKDKRKKKPRFKEDFDE